MKKVFITEEFERKNQPLSVLDGALRAMASLQGEPSKHKTLVIALDGISFDKVRHMAGEGRLPTFKRLTECGVSTKMRSTIPPDSLPAWPSFITGKNPAKHGMLGYFKFNKETGENIVVNATMISEPKYWNIFSEFGFNSVVMNLPLTFPPEKINGIMISDYLTPQGKIFCYPEELCEKLRQVGYFTELAMTKFFDYDLTRPEPYLYKMEKTKDVAISIMKNYNWDMFTLGFMSMDKAHHMLGLECEGIDMLYKKVDSILAEILGTVDLLHTDIFIVSDHGTVNYGKEFSLHSWLYQKGLLKLNALGEQLKAVSIEGSRRQKYKRNYWNMGWLKIMGFLYRLKVSLNLPRIPFFHFPRQVIEENAINPCPFDWTKTKVYSLMPPTSNYLPIFINTKGERPFGTVEAGEEYQQLKIFLKNELEGLCDPETGKKIVERIYEKEELYSGPFLAEMPDIVARLRQDYIGFTGYSNRGRIIKGPIFKKFNKPVLNHSIESIFIFCGPNSRHNTEVQDMDIIDVFPNILYSRNLPIPEDVDGKVRRDIFKEEFCANVQPKFRKPTIKEPEARKSWLKKHSQTDLELIESELKRLGYIK